MGVTVGPDRRRLSLLFGFWTAAWPHLAAAQARPDTTARAVVTAVTLGTVYIGAGRNDGLREGTLLRIPKLGPRAVYPVQYLSSKSAAAKGDSLAPLPSVGDTVLFQAVVEAARTTTGPAAAAGRRPRPVPLRGRIGFRYLGSWERADSIAMKQPAFELLLEGPVAPGAPIGVNLDVRSRRTSLYRPGRDPTSNGVVAVYQAALRIQAGGPFRAIVGRQYAPVLAGVGLYDGLLLDLEKPTWGAGLMAGVAPDQGSLAFSTDLKQAGLFVQGHNRVGAPFRWGLTAGGMGSYVAGQVNREFGFLQATVGTRIVSALVLQEIDINRGWKVAAGEPRFSLTSTFASLSLTPANGISLNGGFDSRRNIRLYRDLTTPEDLFDDRFRQGLWGSASVTLARKLRLGGDVRTNRVSGADSLTTTAWSVTASLDQLTPAGIGLRFRGTRYQVPLRGPGTLLSGALRLAPPSLGALEFNGGSRTEPVAPDQDRFWAGLSAELFVRRSWFLLVTVTREWGRNGLTPTTDLLYGGLSYRF
jgi:hypothetical protein